MDINPYLLLLILVTAVIWGIYVGRAKGARWKRLSQNTHSYKVLVVIGAIGIYFVVTAINQFVGDGKKDVLKKHFRLSDNTTFTEFATSREFQANIEGKVQFTDSQWNSYIANLNKPNGSKPILLHKDGQLINTETAHALGQWQALPRPLTKKDKKPHLSQIPQLYRYWWDYKKDTVNGKILCVVYHGVGNAQRDGAFSRTYDHYKISDCANVTQGEGSSGLMFGILDYDARTLFMKIQSPYMVR